MDSPAVDKPYVEHTWTLIAEEIEDVPQSLSYEKKITREAAFAYEAEAIAWTAEQVALGFKPDGITSYATKYFGPTDSPSNCWLAHVYKEAITDET